MVLSLGADGRMSLVDVSIPGADDAMFCAVMQKGAMVADALAATPAAVSEREAAVIELIKVLAAVPVVVPAELVADAERVLDANVRQFAILAVYDYTLDTGDLPADVLAEFRAIGDETDVAYERLDAHANSVCR